MSRQIYARALRDVGLAAWFGGSLMGVIGINAAVSTLPDPQQRQAVSHAAWARWRPVHAAAISAYLFGARLLRRDAATGAGGSQAPRRGRTFAIAAGGVALSAAVFGSVLEHKIQRAGRTPLDSTGPIDDTPPSVADAQVTLRAVQWVIPALTGSLLVATARQTARSAAATRSAVQDSCVPPRGSITSAWRAWRSESSI